MKIHVLLAALAATLCVQAQAPFASLPPETVVAKIDGGKDITAGEIRKVLEAAPQIANLLQSNPTMALSNIFMTYYLSGEADKVKLGEESPLKEQIEMNRKQTVAAAFVTYERNNFTVSEQDINAFYAQNQSRYEQAKIKVILIAFRAPAPAAGTSPEATAAAARAALEAAHGPSVRSEAEAKSLAEDLAKKIRGGADFVKLVGQYSEDLPSKSAGGDFGVVTRASAYSNEIKTAIFALKPGQVSDPVRSGNSFYIIRLEEKSVQPLKEAMASIVGELKQKHMSDWFDGIQKRFTPTIVRPDFFARPTSGPMQNPAAPVNPQAPGK